MGPGLLRKYAGVLRVLCGEVRLVGTEMVFERNGRHCCAGGKRGLKEAVKELGRLGLKLLLTCSEQSKLI
jgi:hypothetical protein